MIVDNLRLTGEKIFLRLLRESDASEEYRSWLNDPVANKYLETRQATMVELKKYINEKLKSDDALFLGIFWKENGRHIGNIKLQPIDTKKKDAVVGILIGNKDYWGKGVATEAVNLLSAYAFDVLGLRKIGLGVIFGNQAAIRVYGKCGFMIKKVESKTITRDGQLFDKIWMEKICGSK